MLLSPKNQLHLFSVLTTKFKKIFHFESICLFTTFLPVCEDGFYNTNCDAMCGQCSNDAPCNKLNGTCTEGCRPNFKNPLCQGKYL